MTTPRVGAIVSLAAGITVTALLAACARAPSRAALGAPASVESRSLAIRFENSGREHVHVYLIGEQREWLLGRVAPGAIATLRVPDASLASGSQFVRLAVLVGEPVAVGVARDPHATLTIVQPRSALLATQWRFSEGALTPIWR